MVKKIVYIFISFVLCLACAGCGTIKQKFALAKSEQESPVPVPRMHSNGWWYKTHYTYWRYWEEELIGSLTSNNSQKHIRCVTEALYNLKKMGERLTDEKQKELEPFIVQLENISSDIIKKDITPGYSVLLKSNMEKHKRVTDKQFKYSKVWRSIKPDSEKLPEQDYE
ncbi:MAG: hypothetical protein V1893_03305 [Candidatus Omnitrophota bacterium]